MQAFIYVLIIVSTATQSVLGRLFSKKSSQSTAFNALKSCSALVLFSFVAVFNFTFHIPTIIFGALYGVSLCVSMYAGYQAICRGPMALSSMLVSFSVIIPLVWGVTVGNETLKIIQYFAIAFLFCAFIITNLDKIVAKKQTKKDGTNYGVWLLFVAITFISNGVCSILQKQHQTFYPGMYSKEFMVFAMLFCLVVFSIFAFVKIPYKKFRSIKGKWLGLFAGVANSVANFLTLWLAGQENASVLFPMISAGTILASLLCGRLIFKEKLKINHYFALVFGISAVVLLKL